MANSRPFLFCERTRWLFYWVQDDCGQVSMLGMIDTTELTGLHSSPGVGHGKNKPPPARGVYPGMLGSLLHQIKLYLFE